MIPKRAPTARSNYALGFAYPWVSADLPAQLNACFFLIDKIIPFLRVYLDRPESLVDRKPSLYFTPSGLRLVRRRLKRLSRELQSYSTVDALYEEILDCFTSNGRERRPRPPKSSSAPAWVNFVPDEIQEVRLLLSS